MQLTLSKTRGDVRIKGAGQVPGYSKPRAYALNKQSMIAGCMELRRYVCYYQRGDFRRHLLSGCLGLKAMI